MTNARITIDYSLSNISERTVKRQMSEVLEAIDTISLYPATSPQSIHDITVDVDYDAKTPQGLMPQEVEALADTVRLALEDQNHYLSTGYPPYDYSEDEWPSVAQQKAEVWKHATSALCKLNMHGLAMATNVMAQRLAAEGSGE